MTPETAKAFVGYLTEGIDVMTSAKRNGQSIQEVVNQGDMLSGGVSPYGGAVAELCRRCDWIPFGDGLPYWVRIHD